MSWLGHSMTLDQAAILIAVGVTATFAALHAVFSGFFAESGSAVKADIALSAMTRLLEK